METLASKRKKYYRKCCLKHFCLSFASAPIVAFAFYYLTEISVPAILFWVAMHFLIRFWQNMIKKREGYRLLEIVFNEESVDLSVTRLFHVRQIHLSPAECKIKHYEYETKKEGSFILLYPSGKQCGGYLIRAPLWTYEEQTSILNSLTQYDGVKIDTVKIYR